MINTAKTQKFPIYAIGIILFCLTSLLQAQEVPRPYSLSRVGEVLGPEVAKYFLLFPQWSGYGEEYAAMVEVQVWRQAEDSIRFERTDASVTAIVISDSAAIALAFYLEHFEELHREEIPLALPTSDRVPQHLRRGMQELLDREVLPPWWPGWSRKDGEKFVQIALRDDREFRGRLIGTTSRQLFLWTDSIPYAPELIPEHLHSLRWDELEVMRVPDEVSSGLGLIGMAGGLLLANMAIDSDEGQSQGDYVDLANSLGRAMLMGLGALGFLDSDEIMTEYRPLQAPDPASPVTIAGSPLHRARLFRPGMPPEIAVMIDTTGGEVVLSDLAPLPLQRQIRDDERAMQSGFWVGAEQLWLENTEGYGFLTGGAAGYLLPLWDLQPGLIRCGIDIIASAADDFGSVGLRGFLQSRWWRLGGGIRGVILAEELHLSITNSSSWGSYYYNRTELRQHASKPGNYLFADFGFEITLRRVSIGVHRLVQFAPSAYLVSDSEESGKSWSAGKYQNVETGLRITAWALSIQVQI